LDNDADHNGIVSSFHHRWCSVDKSVTHITIATLGAHSLTERIPFTVVLSCFIIAVDELTAFHVNTLPIHNARLLQTVSHWKQTLLSVCAVSEGDIKLLVASIIDGAVT